MLAKICQATAPKTVKLVEPPPTTCVVDSDKPAFHCAPLRSDLLITCVDVILMVDDTRSRLVGIIWCRYGEISWLGIWRKKDKFLESRNLFAAEEGKVV